MHANASPPNASLPNASLPNASPPNASPPNASLSDASLPKASLAYAAARHRVAARSCLVIGVDEAGRGPLAGPVVAGAVLLGGAEIAGLDDSKKLSAARRSALEGAIKARCGWAVGVVSPQEIDRVNILVATMRAMALAVSALIEQIGMEEPGAATVMVLIDGNLTPAGRVAEWRWPARAIVGGDAIEPCISAASIIAKQHRDALMRYLAESHPEYGWERNAGYGTPEHLAALRRHGPTPHHRRSFAPVAQLELLR